MADGAYTLIDGSAFIDLSGLENLGEENAFDLNNGKQAYFSTGSLVVNVVPEPSTYAWHGLAAFAPGAHVRRRGQPGH